MKIIGLAADHAGFEIKEYIKSVLDKKGVAYKDFGTCTPESCDYPDFAHPLAIAVESGEVHSGIAVCGSGNGIAMTLNKHQEIRAAICWEEEIAQLARAHNDINVLVLPGRYISKDEAKLCVVAFLEAPFEGGRHQRRVEKISIAAWEAGTGE